MPVLNIAHRGGAGLRPENTLSAFAHAVKLGADGAELDVQLTRDGHVVVFHDNRLKPETCRDRRGVWLARPGPCIAELTLAEIETYDVGRPRPDSAYAREHPDLVPADGERIPLLAEVVDIVRHAPKPFHLFVELKTSFSDRNLSAPPEALAEATLAVLDKGDYGARSVLVGFDWPGLIHAKKREPKIACWFTTLAQSWFGDAPPEDEPPPAPALQMLRHWAAAGTSPWAGGYDAVHFGGSIIEAIKSAGGDGWFAFHRDASAEMVAAARKLGLKIGAWTVNDPATMKILASRGVDALCTDRPDMLKAALGG
jgi:glycerophosphoryl diester phosphodiesterase